jgi:Uma2 family endonuclease
MIEAGILTDDDPVELLDGCLVPKMPKSPSHALATGLILDAIVRLLPAGWFADSQEPITTEDSEPEPDVRVVRGERRDFRDRHPGPQDLALVVEVSDATLERDRTIKQKLYARAGVPFYWIVSLRDRRIEVHSEPSGTADVPGYGQSQELAAGEEVPLILDGAEIGRLAVSALLP